MKDIVLISESLFLTGEIPPHFHNPDKFEVRTFQDPKELFVLTSALTPTAIAIDLTTAEFTPKLIHEFVNQLRFSPQKISKFIPLLGIINKNQFSETKPYYEAGVNSLLVRPYEPQTFLESLETLIGRKFRKYERKRVNFPVLLIDKEGKTWPVNGKVINLECLLVMGDSLPPEGVNVYMKGLDSDLPSFRLWVHCWRSVQDSILLRYLNPPADFLHAIQNLPSEKKEAEETQKSAPQIQNLAEKGLVSNPYGFEEFEMSTLLNKISEWIDQKESPPAIWEEILIGLPENERNYFSELRDSKINLKEVFLLKLILRLQLEGLQKGPKNELSPKESMKILNSHEKKVRQASEAIQKLLLECFGKGGIEEVNDLNQLKSDLQKYLIGLQNALKKSFEKPDDDLLLG